MVEYKQSFAWLEVTIMLILVIGELIILGGLWLQAVCIVDEIKRLIKREFETEDITDVVTGVVFCSIIWGISAFCQLYVVGGFLDIVFMPEIWVFVVSLIGWVCVWVLLFMLPNTKKGKEYTENKERELKAKQEETEKEIESNKRFFADFISKDSVVKVYSWEDEKSKNAICAEKEQFTLISAHLDRKYKATIRNVPYANLIDCQIVEDNSTIVEGGVGRAIVGGIIAGGAGAIVGASTRSSSDVINRLEIRIITSDLSDARISIVLIDRRVNRSCDLYEEQYTLAQDIYSMVVAAMSTTSISSKPEVENAAIIMEQDVRTSDMKNRLERIHALRETGIISEKEYNDARERILSEL